MDMAGYLVTAVLVEGRSPREVASAHEVSKTWVYELLARYGAEGEAGLVPRSKRPRRSPTKVAHALEDEVVLLRNQLTEEGFEAGPETIRTHLLRRPAGQGPFDVGLKKNRHRLNRGGDRGANSALWIVAVVACAITSRVVDTSPEGPLRA